MDKSIIVELVEALESGNYEQVRESYLEGVNLQTKKPYCCALGTLILTRGVDPTTIDCGGITDTVRPVLTTIEEALEAVEEGLAHTIVEMNDHGVYVDSEGKLLTEEAAWDAPEDELTTVRPDFAQIATFMRQKFPEHFEGESK